MTAPGPSSDAPPAQAAQPLLQAWRESGAWRLDPARFHTLEALVRRLDGQTPAVLERLKERLAKGLADYARRLAAAPAPGPSPAPVGPARGPRVTPARGYAPLAELNAGIRHARAARAGAGDELASVQGFREAWSRIHAQEQVARAVARKPAQAGPLNSQVLTLDALALMGEVSPGYLRRFMVYVESLQWLEAAASQSRPAPDKPGRQRRASTSTRPARPRGRTG